MALHPKFYEGRTPPLVHQESIVMEDWMEEQKHYCFEGREVNGTRLTGNQYHFLNFVQILRTVDSIGTVDWGFPLFSQEDDYIYKQAQEAKESSMYTGLITGRGLGKTYLALNVIKKNYTFIASSHNIISASIDDTAKHTFSMLDLMLDRTPDYLRHSQLRKDINEGYIESGAKVIYEGKEKIVGLRSVIEKIIYDNKAGKTRGRRPTFQLYEEIGAWTGAAKLKQCLSASKGSFFRGKFMTAEVWLIGTGGQMKTGGSQDAQDIFYNPAAHNVYACQEWYKKKTMIFIPSYKKFTGFYEKDGISDEVGARAVLDQRREEAKGDIDAYMQEIQEFPYEPKEAFMTSGTRQWNVDKLQRQEFQLKTNPDLDGIIQRGRFWWIKSKGGTITGVEFNQEKDGPVQLLEHPYLLDGQVPPNLYIGGVDSVDNSVDMTGKSNSKKAADIKKLSKFSLLIKKRFYNAAKTSNLYVCQITWRPEVIEDAFEQALMASIYYNVQLNVEHTKIAVIKYFEYRKQLKRLFPRPSVCYADVTKITRNNKYGTVLDGAGKVIVYGLDAISKYIDSFWDNIFFLDLIEELIKFDNDNRTEYDRVMAMMMTEIADDELIDIMVKEKTKEPAFVNFGYYTDKYGVRKFGEIPSNKSTEELFPNKTKDVFS